MTFNIKIIIIDTVGQDTYQLLRDKHISKGEGFICVYSIKKMNTFTETKIYINRIKKIKDCSKFPLVIVGNMYDLEEERVVGFEQGQKLARENSCKIFETSAKTGKNIDKVFEQIVQNIKLYRSCEIDYSDSDDSDIDEIIPEKKKCTLL